MNAPVTDGALRCLRPQPDASARVVCFPHAGGGPNSFRGLAMSLAPKIEVWEVMLPGRGSRSGEAFATTWHDLVAELTDAVERRPGDGPTAFFGHSFGGLVAYEVAGELERRNNAPEHLFVSGCRAPHRGDANRWPLPDDDDGLVTEVEERYGAIPQVVRDEPTLLARFLPILRADLALFNSYRWDPARKLTIPITALAGNADKAGPPHELPYWGERTDAEFRSITMLGTHFFVYSEVDEIGAVVRRSLFGEQ